MKAIKGFLKLSPGEKWIFFEAYFLSVAISLLINLLPFKWLAKRLGRHMNETSFTIDPRLEETALKTGILIQKTVRFIPWNIKCLTRAVVGKFILKQKKIRSTLYLGVKKDNAKMEAHAWLRVGNKIITGKEVANEFTIVSYFGD
ncbi:MAG: lasso peptide biosynthesis B2 protein [Ignavibacteria bacterium]|jgi:hypothetical protein